MVSIGNKTTFEKLATDLNYDLAVEVFINNFNDDERSAVRMLLEANEQNLKDELEIELLDFDTPANQE